MELGLFETVMQTPRRSKVASKGFAKLALYNFIVLGNFTTTYRDFSSNFQKNILSTLKLTKELVTV